MYILYYSNSRPPLSTGGYHLKVISYLLRLNKVRPVGSAGINAVRIEADAGLSSELPIALTDLTLN